MKKRTASSQHASQKCDVSSCQGKKQSHCQSTDVTYGYGWNGKLRDVLKWAAMGTWCVAWSTVLGVAFIGLTQHVFAAYTRGELSTKNAAIALAGALGPTIAHCFMIKNAVRVWKDYGHEIGIGRMLVKVPTEEQHVSATPSAERSNRLDEEGMDSRWPRSPRLQNSPSLVLLGCEPKEGKDSAIHQGSAMGR